MALRWIFLLLLTPLLAEKEYDELDLNDYGEPQETERCKAPSDWDPKLQFTPNQRSYALNELVQLSCAGKFVPSVPQIRCISSGTQTLWNETATCKERCQTPQWVSKLHLNPKQNFYWLKEEVTLSCFEKDPPPFAVMRCANGTSPGWKRAWEVKDIQGTWHKLTEKLTCSTENCTKPEWDEQLEFPENNSEFPQNDHLQLTCPKDLKPSFSEVKCAKELQEVNSGKPSYRQAWWGRNSTSAWMRIEGGVQCLGMCQRPQKDSRLQLTPDQENYMEDEEVLLSCPEGFQPSFTKIKCWSDVKFSIHRKSVSWWGNNTRGVWTHIPPYVMCIEVLQVDPGTFEISSTSIKLNWTCRFPGACQGMRAMCRLAVPSSPPCEAEEVEGEEMLHGQEGTFSCSLLQPFTDYSVTIFLHPNMTLFSWLFRTEETVPDKPEKLWLDTSRGSLRWKELPSCKGEIIGYQLNITARSTRDGGFLEMERLQVNGSVTEHRLPEHGPGSSYVVSIQGLTAAGAGAASLWEFQSTDNQHPLGISCRSVPDISPSQGTAVLPLQPITSEGAGEHQLVVAMTHNSSGIESACLGQPQPFSASQQPFNTTQQPLNTTQQPRTYVAAVLNLTAPMDFVLGNGTWGQGYHNAALRPGWDYTALLRLVRRSPQSEKFTCVCYSFSVGQEPVSLLDRMPLVLTLVLVAALLALGILLFFILFRLKYNSSKTSENNSTIPLRRCRGGACKLNTQIPVEELLEALKRFKREEIEAEQTDDESVDRRGVGHLREYQQLSSTLLHPCNAGKEQCNQSKNRYKSIIPYDHCRVVLQPSGTGNDYINASYVDSYGSPHFFIAAQGPLAETVVDFWQMVWQEKTSVVVMLTGLVEQNKIKCEKYWPEQEEVYGDFTVTLNNTRATTGLVTRTFSLQKAGCALPRVVEQFHYLLWPDHGVPRNTSQLLCLVAVVNKRVLEAPAGPVLVHCSAGIGRTGTFIALDFLLKMGKAEGKVDVFRCVQQLREQRVSMVQTKEQYTFLYEALLEGLLCGNTGVPVESIATLVHSLQEAQTSRPNSVLDKEFKALQKFSELFQLLPCREAEKPSNQPKNRKPGILPADSCRPILMSSLKADGSPGYINAVFASTYTEEDRIVITQLPFPTTLVDFWALVWDYTCTSVVVLNQLQELDKTYVEFWPTQGEDDYGRFHVQLVSEEPGAGFTAWTLALTNRQQPKKSALEVQLWQLKDWPMQERLPPHPATIISLLGKVETHHRQSQGGHILVTCWDGASRSGIFCAASFLCEQIQSEGMVDVSQAVRTLKRRRRQLIKDVEQYGLCYELALSYLNSFETYGNFK
ncbi:receptor-type tyrosine-protein phosphatase kappa-like [Manacus candei]|uniref:receptor-type tyrosine-protein phosphatase kappa-like n=1 Tax=Manacus candei TaxID=415023 RepID=UPI002226D65E|nr:receptor-type tyrosine-protein phosphatase kappa-like [Manacus candei]